MDKKSDTLLVGAAEKDDHAFCPLEKWMIPSLGWPSKSNASNCVTGQGSIQRQVLATGQIWDNMSIKMNIDYN